jgi:hypothetical protein
VDFQLAPITADNGRESLAIARHGGRPGRGKSAHISVTAFK